MSGYGSPSIRKSEGPFGRQGRPKKRFTLGRIIGDPFALSTISIAILAWLIAFVSSIIAAVKRGSYHGFPNYGWWAIVYYLMCIVGVIVMVAADAIYTYHVACVGFLSTGLFLSIMVVNLLVYSPDGSQEASAAGFILLSIVAIVWIFYFGSQPQASHRAFIDSFALHRGTTDGPSAHTSRHISPSQFGAPQTQSFMNNPPPGTNRHNLNGFETSSPSPQYAGPGAPTSPTSQTAPTRAAQNTNSTYRPSNLGPAGNEDPPNSQTEYPYKARAIYSYEANPDDANEISFQKHEILELSDVNGRWWQARKTNGETGIAPSNYLIFL